MARYRSRPRRWIVVLVVGWAVLLAGAGVWGVVRGEATAREQTTVAETRPVVDRLMAEVASAASADGLAVVSVSAFERVDTCSVTVFRDGAHYRRTVTALVAPGTEQALLDRVAARLPAAYGATVRPGAVPRLYADGGFFVAVTGTVGEPGRVAFVADTGQCRTVGDVSSAASRPGTPGGPGQRVLERLRAKEAQWTVHEVLCPGGGALTTVEAVVAAGTDPGSLDEALHGTVTRTPVVATAELFAYRDGDTGVAVRFDGPRAVVTATTPCR
jgi:hypothetical protein